MKQIIKYTFLAIACLPALTMQGKTIKVNVNTLKGDITKELRSIGEKTAINDTAVLNFGKGTYTLNGTIQFWCHVIINGQGSSQTTIILNDGRDQAGFKAFKDDCFIKCIGRLNHPISVSISNISIKLKDHHGIWWEENERYAVKIYHANKVDIHHVDSYMANAHITNFDLRVCSNVTVSDCNITNYNNSKTGGCLWIRGEAHNIMVSRNKFYKYGKDETLAFYSRLVDANDYVRGSVTRSDIYVNNNEFHYGGEIGISKNTDAYNQMIVSLFTDHKKSSESCTTRNFHLNNNSFFINDKCTRCLYISFDPADHHSGIYVENNTIVNASVKNPDKYYRQDIEVNDLSQSKDTIYINGNTIKNNNLVLNKYGTHGYSFLLIQGGNVCLDGNTITNSVLKDPSTGKSTGVQLLWVGASGGSAVMRNNVCKGIKYISTVGAGDGTESFTLNASNNYFSGDTRVYCHKISNLHLNFTNNTFESNDGNFFLQEFASRGSLIFNNNLVSVSTGNGKLMTHWAKTSLQSMRFDRLEVKNNKFTGVKNEYELLKNISNVGKRKVSNNIIKPQ